MDWTLDTELIESFLDECGTDGEKWESKFNNIPKEERFISFDFTCPDQINVRINGLKNKKGTGIPRTDILTSEITTLKELWRKKK